MSKFEKIFSPHFPWHEFLNVRDCIFCKNYHKKNIQSMWGPCRDMYVTEIFFLQEGTVVSRKIIV